MRPSGPTPLALALVLLAAACSPGTVTPAEVAAARERLRPKVTDVEIEEAIEECLRENAVTSIRRLPNGGGFVGEGVTERDEQVMQDCKSAVFDRYPDWPPPQPQTRAEHLVFYELYLEMANCIRRLGYTVEVPSFDWYAENDGNWYPYDELPDQLSREEWKTVNEHCPQNPWTYETE